MANFNSRTRSLKHNQVVKNFGEEMANDNGERLINLCEYEKLKIPYGFFQHKNIHKFSCIQPMCNLESIIKYFSTK